MSEAAHGSAAVAAIAVSILDLVVTDMMMAVMDGPEPIRWLRADFRFAGLSILCVSGNYDLAVEADIANATTDRKAVYYTTNSQPHAKLVENLTQFTFFTRAALGPNVEYIHLGDLLREPATAEGGLGSQLCLGAS